MCEVNIVRLLSIPNSRICKISQAGKPDFTGWQINNYCHIGGGNMIKSICNKNTLEGLFIYYISIFGAILAPLPPPCQQMSFLHTSNKSNLQNPTYQTKQNLPYPSYQTQQTNPTKPILPNPAYNTRPIKPSLQN